MWDRQKGASAFPFSERLYFLFPFSCLSATRTVVSICFVFFVGFFFYVIMPVMSMRMTCRVRSIKVKGLRSPRSPNECLDGGLEGRNATSLLVLS